MASGRINRNAFPELKFPARGGFGGTHLKQVCTILSAIDDIGPTECHRTAKANIRSHLYGGPQGWNPHFLRI